ncbi:hypothetical protein VYU27_009179 [Nannochloropsis oceanica]
MASDGGNADTYAYEEEQERKALLQSLYGPMKTWFHGGEASSIKERFGPYPSFWQDLLTWEHTRVVQKLYLRWMDTGASGEDLLGILGDTKKEVTVEVVEAAAGTNEGGKEGGGEVGGEDRHVNGGAGNGGGRSSSALTEEQQQQEEQKEQEQEQEHEEKKAEEKEKRRKSRWGGGEGETGTLTAAATTAAGESKRRSRWGDGGGATGEAGNKKKSRWSQPEAPPGAALDPETLQEIIALQLRLDNIHQRTVGRKGREGGRERAEGGKNRGDRGDGRSGQRKRPG